MAKFTAGAFAALLIATTVASPVPQPPGLQVPESGSHPQVADTVNAVDGAATRSGWLYIKQKE